MYFVVLPDGQKFGPADLNLLNQWAAEGRIVDHTMLENAQTGQRIPAGSLPGLTLTATMGHPSMPYQPPGTMNAPQPYAGYYRGPSPMGDYGQNDVTMAYVFGGLGIAPCLGLGGFCSLFGVVFAVLGLVFAKKAEEKGNPSANSAKILCWVALGLQILLLLFSLFLMAAMG